MKAKRHLHFQKLFLGVIVSVGSFSSLIPLGRWCHNIFVANNDGMLPLVSLSFNSMTSLLTL